MSKAVSPHPVAFAPRRSPKVLGYRNLDGAGTAYSPATTHYFYDGSNVMLQVDQAGAVTHRYLHRPAVDQILADEDVATGIVYWPLADNQGTVRDVLQHGGNGVAVEHVQYDSFGRIISDSNPAYTGHFAYTGREWDADAGLYDYRARWYDPAVGRFLSQDPLGLAPDTNPYRYVLNSPTNYIDPTGRGPIPIAVGPPLPPSVGAPIDGGGGEYQTSIGAATGGDFSGMLDPIAPIPPVPGSNMSGSVIPGIDDIIRAELGPIDPSQFSSTADWDWLLADDAFRFDPILLDDLDLAIPRFPSDANNTGGYPGGGLNPLNWMRGLYTGDCRAPDEVYNAALAAGGVAAAQQIAGTYINAGAGAEGGYQVFGSVSVAPFISVSDHWEFNSGVIVTVGAGPGLPGGAGYDFPRFGYLNTWDPSLIAGGGNSVSLFAEGSPVSGTYLWGYESSYWGFVVAGGRAQGGGVYYNRTISWVLSVDGIFGPDSISDAINEVVDIDESNYAGQPYCRGFPLYNQRP